MSVECQEPTSRCGRYKIKRPPTAAASLLQIRLNVLFELGRDALELRIERGAKAVHDRNDGERDARGLGQSHAFHRLGKGPLHGVLGDMTVGIYFAGKQPVLGLPPAPIDAE